MDMGCHWIKISFFKKKSEIEWKKKKKGLTNVRERAR